MELTALLYCSIQLSPDRTSRKEEVFSVGLGEGWEIFGGEAFELGLYKWDLDVGDGNGEDSGEREPTAEARRRWEQGECHGRAKSPRKQGSGKKARVGLPAACSHCPVPGAGVLS